MTKKTAAEYERLGRMLESLYEVGQPTKRQLYKVTFVKGLISGLGGALGASVLIGLLIWIIGLFNHIPIIGPFIETIKRTLG